MTISNPTMATNAPFYLLTPIPSVAIFKLKTCTKTCPKNWISSIPVTLTKNIHYTTKNHRVLGKFKSETGSLAPREFVGLRAKMYSLDVPANPKQSKIRVKGIKKSYIKRKVRHEQFVNVLKSLKPTPSTFRTFLSSNHVLRTVEITKACLNAFDDKRYILDDGVTTLAYGHKNIHT